MKIIAVTGPIASGKTSLSKKLSKILGYPFWSADACVQNLLAQDACVQQNILILFPEISGKREKVIEKDLLRERALRDVESLKNLERALHPAVEKLCRAFIQEARKNNLKGVILEIPLLFEAGLEKEADIIILVESSPFYQKRRLLKRSKMTVEQASVFEERLLPLSEKRKKAHIVIKNGFFLYWSLFKILWGLQKIPNFH
ncbi:MAG: dephospho-CoA kinase [Alphaproteobacteria bacterium 16-39-46]|nr:MAG: dephospho-CoA kinase [Alphaproteobacteria bacterium 16-39-46]OZA42475.1 MAG: dephospho-CoA kinase [Alphaproteobacteria bacterium 17-39-52]HQS84432.1 dephospho-CoA kinase [Alphaproteobacteria bacterium]HQS94388.1 dephospho-CoA kinase [Alphaproteobacteria bacterium]